MRADEIISARHAEMKAWLVEQKLSVDAFARAAGVSMATASQWVYSGRPPRTLAREKLHQAFPACPVLKWGRY